MTAWRRCDVLCSSATSHCLAIFNPVAPFNNLPLRHIQMMAKKSPNPTDKYVGSRVRMRRLMLSMSQEKLGEKLGLTFQQVQKYEKGTNRIGASRLQHIAQILKVPVSFFFEGVTGPAKQAEDGSLKAPVADYVSDFLSSTDGLALTKAFTNIKDSKLRRRVVDLVEEIAGEQR
jgi:transcriptional regulator with XRE-family HTH domain